MTIDTKWIDGIQSSDLKVKLKSYLNDGVLTFDESKQMLISAGQGGMNARARAAAMTEEEKWLFAPKFELPEHLRKFKGFYDVSGLDSHKIEDPTSLFAKVKATKSTIKAKIAEIHTSKRTLDAKLFR